MTSALLALANIDHIFPQHTLYQIFQLLINPSRLLLCAISVILVWQTSFWINLILAPAKAKERFHWHMQLQFFLGEIEIK